MRHQEEMRAERARVTVVHVSSAHPWTDNRVHLREAQALAESGYIVHLVAVENGLSLPATGVNVVRIRRRKRLQRVLLGSAVALAEGLRTRARIFHLHDPELAWAIPLLRAMRKIVVYDAHEDLPSQMRDKLYVPRQLRSMVSHLATLVVGVTKFANHIVVATERIAERYPSAKVTVVRNFPRLRLADEKNDAVEIRPRTLVYVGAISETRGALQMLDALGSDTFPEGWTLELAGSIVPQSLEARMRAHAAWPRVNYHGVVSPDEARDIVGRARVGLVALQANAAYVDSLPTKMFEYFAAGLPVIASDFPLWRRIIEPHVCGTLVDETDAESIAEAVASYASNPEKLSLHGNNALRASKRDLNWTSESEALVRVYDKLSKIRVHQ